MLILDEGVKDGRHEKVCDASACVAEATCEGVGCADDVLVEEARRPYLTWNKAATENADEESKSQKAPRAVYGTGKDGWN